MKLHQPQKKIATDTHRFRVVCCGRRFGKTTLAVEEMIGCAVSKSGRNVAYIAPFYQQARDIAWEMLKERLDVAIQKANESRLEFVVSTIDGGTSKIFLRGWESVESLRGQAFDFVVVDEIASMRKFFVGWEQVLLPTLTDRKGSVLFISTPKGYNHFYELFEMEKESDDFKSFKYSSYDNHYLDPEEINLARDTMSEVAFSQEYMANFEKFEGLIWDLPDEQIINTRDIAFNFLDYTDRVIGGVDWGFDHPAGVLVAKVKDGKYYIIDEYRDRGKTIDEMIAVCKEFQDKYKVSIWYPDPARPDLIEDFKRKGLSCGAVNKDVLVGISEVANLMRNQRLFVDNKCQLLLGEIMLYSWYEGPSGQSVKERPVKENDDLCDTLRYLIMGYRVNLPAEKVLYKRLPTARERVNKMLESNQEEFKKWQVNDYG